MMMTTIWDADIFFFLELFSDNNMKKGECRMCGVESRLVKLSKANYLSEMATNLNPYEQRWWLSQVRTTFFRSCLDFESASPRMWSPALYHCAAQPSICWLTPMLCRSPRRARLRLEVTLQNQTESKVTADQGQTNDWLLWTICGDW